MAKLESKNASIDAKEEILKGFKANIKNLEKEINGKNNSKNSNDIPEIELTGKKTPQEAANLFVKVYTPLIEMEYDEARKLAKWPAKRPENDIKTLIEFEKKVHNKAFDTLQKNPRQFCKTGRGGLWYADKKIFDNYIRDVTRVMAREDENAQRLFNKYPSLKIK